MQVTPSPLPEALAEQLPETWKSRADEVAAAAQNDDAEASAARVQGAVALYKFLQAKQPESRLADVAGWLGSITPDEGFLDMVRRRVDDDRLRRPLQLIPLVRASAPLRRRMASADLTRFPSDLVRELQGAASPDEIVADRLEFFLPRHGVPPLELGRINAEVKKLTASVRQRAAVEKWLEARAAGGEPFAAIVRHAVLGGPVPRVDVAKIDAELHRAFERRLDVPASDPYSDSRDWAWNPLADEVAAAGPFIVERARAVLSRLHESPNEIVAMGARSVWNRLQAEIEGIR